jgi:hypothetical protein
MKRNCCDVIYFKFDTGWDAYRKQDCIVSNGKWIPQWFDNAIAEDMPTKTQAIQEVNSLHVLGVCLVNA